MPVYLFANVGNSDLQKINSDGTCTPLKNQREEAREAVTFLQGLKEEEWAEVGTLYALPILGPTVCSIADDNRAPIDEIFLFVTDQDQRTTPAQFYLKDTAITGEAIKLILLNSPTYRGKVKAVRLLPVLVSPASYDDTYREYAKIFRGLRPREGHWPADAELYALVTGGTPQCNFALMFHFLYSEDLPGRRTVLYKSPNSPADYLEVPRSMRYEHLLGVCTELLERHDYDGIEAIVSHTGLNGASLVHGLLRAASLRLNFRFQEAAEVLRTLRTGVDGSTGARIHRLYCQARQLAEGAELLSQNNGNVCLPVADAVAAVFEELFANLQVKYDNDEGVDFLARLFRLQEAGLKLCAATCNPLFAQSTRAHSELAQKDPAYREYMTKYLGEQFATRPQNRPILYYSTCYYLKELQANSSFTGAAVRSILNWAKKVGLEIPDRLSERQAHSRSNAAEATDLMNLRNKSIAGHGFLGIARAQIGQYFKGDILAETQAMLTQLLSRPPGRPYEEQDNLIRDRLQKLFNPVG
ncbi:MAG: hypothetical protein PWP12_876 [Bacillota bacterium]|nr:hypothetical protein [Bacillota bacterium]